MTDTNTTYLRTMRTLLIDGPRGRERPWTSLFDCRCEVCERRARDLNSRSAVDRAIDDLAEAFDVSRLTIAHALALTLAPEASGPAEQQPLFVQEATP